MTKFLISKFILVHRILFFCTASMDCIDLYFNTAALNTNILLIIMIIAKYDIQEIHKVKTGQTT